MSKSTRPQGGPDSSNSTPDPSPQNQVHAREELIEGETVSLAVHHFIPSSQKVYEHIPQFVRRHLADPAATVSPYDIY